MKGNDAEDREIKGIAQDPQQASKLSFANQAQAFYCCLRFMLSV
jgi:hypothetical protein